MKQLCIIPCGKKKIWDKNKNIGPVTAKEAYIGIFHSICERYANTFFKENWVILSAKHGLLLPSDIVEENYDLTFNMKSNQIITISKLKEQIINKRLDHYQDIIVLTGKKYKPIVESSFKDISSIQFPLEGSKGIGHMQQRLKYAVVNKTPIHK
ncbi:DUF6884 domain-containing protein [Aquibacillus rhizosphaerae]|uniref:DUF6884 domain-containing protein n=1 Tax=Aquibacillus rhizosphaerae TaxID=3051431 RepID=A0ABT7L8L1_9BACI|nr:DUF6884 domain-containing protein [Aquibacillus sp. LR5S19]MDL4842199.1 hypothetical protein [Aquibacillus sp. LR5S19]